MSRFMFEEVAIRVTKRWKDESGKKRQQTKKFYQTINPFNKNAKGLKKNRSEILAELKEESEAWLNESHGGQP